MNRGATLLLTELAAPLLNSESASRVVSQTVPRQTTDPVSYGGSTLNCVGSTVTAPQSGGYGIGFGIGIGDNHSDHDRGFDGIGRGHGSSGRGHEFGR
jgi:hypothetical protein